jgi:predicted AAA+ superfamily ATPase
MYRRICNPLLSRSFFLFGARGTGKTHLLRQLFHTSRFKPGKVIWFDLLKEGELFTFVKNPDEMRQRIEGLSTRPEWVVIDEVQRAPQLLNTVHSLIESSDIKFALTGSSARKLKRGGANLLAGRALLNNLFPLTFSELDKTFSLAEILRWGSLPSVINEKDTIVREQILKSYVEVYLREEIREEQIIRRLDTFARFLEAAAQSSGTIINLSKIGREAATDAKTVTRYFQILEDTLLGYFLEPYHRSIRKRQRQHAKFYLFDIGVKRALEGVLHIPLTPKTYEWGKAFEHLVVLEAIRLNHYSRLNYRLSYLRTQSQLEVDLIAERKGSKTWVIEIKSGNDVSDVDINKLNALAREIPNAHPVILSTINHPKRVEGVRIIPWKDGLAELFG